MAPRKPVTAAEIVAVLRQNPGIQKGHALPYEAALKYLRVELHTTRRRAMAWVMAATTQQPHDFELIGCVGGRVQTVARGEGDELLDVAGYTGKTDVSFWPQLMRDGVAVPKDPDAGNDEFVVLSKDLRAMCVRAAQRHESVMQTAQRLKDLARREAEKRYGQSLSYLRGALVQAGLDPEKLLDAAYKNGVTGEATLVSISLKDKDIDALAKLLQAQDIEPYPPAQIVTKLPEATKA